LWHLSALVAVAALVSWLAVQFPGSLVEFGLLVFSTVPPFWAASLWELYLREPHHTNLPPPRRLDIIIARVVWFLPFYIVFVPFYVLIAALFQGFD
jgi:hypothetical protein